MKVFVSHSTKDNSIIDKRIKPILLRFFNKEEIILIDSDRAVGQHWLQIDDGIKTCDFFIVLITDNSNKAPVVINEVDMALEYKGSEKILPFLINTSDLGAMKPLIKHINPARYDSGVNNAESIKDYIKIKTGLPERDGDEDDYEKSYCKKNKRLCIATISVVAIILIAGLSFLIYKLVNKSQKFENTENVVKISDAYIDKNEPKNVAGPESIKQSDSLVPTQKKTNNIYSPIISISTMPPFEKKPSNPQLMVPFDGKVTGIPNPQNYYLVVYAYTNRWWVQPFDNEPFTTISQDGTWQLETHLGGKYLVMVVNPNYKPTKYLYAVPNVGGNIVCKKIIEK